MKNSRVILPCCFCQECVIFFFFSSFFPSPAPSLPPLAVILIICPSELAFLSLSRF